MLKWILSASVLLLFSCEKNIDFNLNKTAPLLVVEAQIENQSAPTVVLTKSFSYFTKISVNDKFRN